MTRTQTLPEALRYLEAHQLARLTDVQCAEVHRTGLLMLAAADGVDGEVLFSTVISLAAHLLDLVAAHAARPKPRKPNRRR
jgi:hypothetical protein